MSSRKTVNGLATGRRKRQGSKRTLKKTHLQKKGPRVKLIIAYRTPLCITKHPQGSATRSWGSLPTHGAKTEWRMRASIPLPLAC